MNLDVEGTPNDDPLKRMARRRREERPRYYKIVLPRGAGGTEGWRGITLPFGNHSAKTLAGQSLPTLQFEGIGLGHFPVRGRTQLASRVIGGWLANLAKDPNFAQTGAGYQKRDLFPRLTRSGGLDALTVDELEAISLNYAQTGDQLVAITKENAVVDRPQLTYVRRYANLGRLDPLATLARSFEYYLTRQKPAISTERDASVPGSTPMLADTWLAASDWEADLLRVLPTHESAVAR